MRMRRLGIGGTLAAISATGILHARQAPRKARDAKAAERLAVAKLGYGSIFQAVKNGVRGDETDKLPLRTPRIMDAQVDATGDPVAAARGHLERTKYCATRVEAARKAAQAPQSAALDGRYGVLEAESILAKAQAR